MKVRILTFLLFLLAASQISAQEVGKINPKSNWYFGAEIGSNTITSIKPEHENSFQGGILTEYYFAQHWSISARLKYFQTGISYNDQTEYKFSGSVISLPLNLNWEFGIAGNFNGNLKLGVALNKEFTKIYNFPAEAVTDYSTFFGTFNPGLGFTYHLNDNLALYTNYEVYILGNDHYKRAGDLDFLPKSTNNNHFNIGVKHTFKH